jgi:TPR repeat protein
MFRYKKSAEQNNIEAQFNLGICYEYGQGIDRDLKESLFW